MTPDPSPRFTQEDLCASGAYPAWQYQVQRPPLAAYVQVTLVSPHAVISVYGRYPTPAQDGRYPTQDFGSEVFVPEVLPVDDVDDEVDEDCEDEDAEEADEDEELPEVPESEPAAPEMAEMRSPSPESARVSRYARSFESMYEIAQSILAFLEYFPWAMVESAASTASVFLAAMEGSMADSFLKIGASPLSMAAARASGRQEGEGRAAANAEDAVANAASAKASPKVFFITVR